MLALALLSPPVAIGTALGSPLAFSLAPLVGLWAAVRTGGVVSAGVLAGLAAALDHRAALAALPLLVAVRTRDGRLSGATRARALLAALGAYALVVVPVALLDPGAFLARALEVPAAGPGLGLFNLLAYRGAESSAFAVALAAAAPALALLLTLGLLRLRASATVVAGLASLIGIVLAPAISPEVVVVPLVLFALAAVEGEAGRASSGFD